MEKNISGDATDQLIEITEENIDEYAKQLQFDTLVRECVLEDLCKSYNISREDMFVLVHALKNAGNNIVTLKTSGYKTNPITDKEERQQITLIRNFGHENLINDLSYEIVDDDEETKVMLISDLRFGSIYSQHTILNDMFEKAKKMGVKYVFLTGDVVEGIFTGAKTIYNTTLHKYGYEDQAEFVASFFPRVEGITTYFVTGEHDLSFLRTKAKVDIGNLIQDKREDMIYLGPRRKKVDFVTSDRRTGKISIYLQHAKGNVPYTVSYKPQQKIASLRNEEKTEILVTSHFGACDSFLRRGVRSIQVPTVTATTDEMKDASTPVYNTIGAWIVGLKKDKTGKLENTTQMWIPYYKTIPDDYKTAKALYISDTKKVFIPRREEKDERDKVISSIKSGESFDEICSRLGLSKLKFGGLVEEAIQRGYDIKLDEENERVVVVKRNKKKVEPIKPDMEELTHVRQVWISDTHLCNEVQQLHMINKVYKEGYERGYREFLHFGDMSDGDYHNRDTHRYELFRLGADRQASYIADVWPRLPGVKTKLIGGNHDGTHKGNGGVDICQMIADKRPDIEYLGSEHAIYHPEVSSKTAEEMFHMGGGCSSSLSYKPQKYIDKMEPGTKPNLLGIGHFHQSEFLAYRNVVALLVPCLTAKSPFATRQALENTMGAYFVDFYVNKKGEVEMFQFEEKRFTQKDVKKDDYLKTKKLVLEK